MSPRVPLCRLSIVFLLPACEPTGGGKGGGGGRLAPTCDNGSDTLGVAGEFAVDSFDFEMTYDPDTFLVSGPVYTFELPSDISGVSATVDLPGEEVGFALWGFGDDVFIDATKADETNGAWWSAPYWHWGALGGTVTLPIDPTTMPDGGGCLFVQPSALSTNLEGDTATFHMVTKRADVGTGMIDVNIVIVGGAALYQEELDATIARMDAVWSGGGGPAVGTVEVYEVGGDSFLYYDDSNELRATELDGGNPQAVNLFIVDDYADEPGTLGEAGGIPGPLGLHGVDGAGTIVALDGHRTRDGTLDVSTMGETAAHEIGHQVGLFHTTESDGTRTEPLDDTAACPESADTDGDWYFSAEECADHDGRNFMFWITGNFTQEEVSEQQAAVLSRSVVSR